MAEQQDTLKGQLSEYRVYESIASGGFGSVYIGRDTSTNVPVAVKRLHPHLKDEPGFVERFEQEASTVRGLVHPNIVRLVDQGRDQAGVPFIVMEWVEGLTIGEWLKRRGRYTSPDAANVGCQVLEGLDAAWARRVVHRDIKPANLMVTPTGRVKIMDFGVAKDIDLATVAGSSGLIGTPAYMAPEQLRGQALDCRADLYALGITLFMMLSGRPPFEGPSFADYFRQHLEQPPPDLRQLAPEVDPGLAAVLTKALAKQPDERYLNPAAMLAALRPYGVEGTPPIPPSIPAEDATVVTRRAPQTQQTVPPQQVVAHDVPLPTVLTRPSREPEPATVAVRPSSTGVARPPIAIAPWMIAAPVVALVVIVGVLFLTVLRPSTSTPADFTPFPTPTTQIVNRGTPQTGGSTLFSDSLTDLATGKLPRASSSPSNFFVSYGADGYVIQKLNPSFAQPVTVAVPGTFGDSDLAVDALIPDPSTNGFIDLGCRDQGAANSRYEMIVTPQTGDVSVRRTGGVIVGMGSANAAASLQHGTPDHLEFVCKATTFIARINGNDVVTATDSTLAQGALVIGAGSANGLVEAHFKNLVVTQP